MDGIMWRFKGNNFTTDAGLDTADMETFKKDAMSSLAREICQNSIDAKRKDNNGKPISGPVKVEFKLFDIPRSNIPGVNDLTEQLKACLDTDIWQKDNKVKAQLNEMLKQINKETITCLRISDFNTSGLYDVMNTSSNSPYHSLIHGTGISNKSSSSGGSKGIGKFATFVVSNFNTVFYSTNTILGEHAYVGISKLCSAKMPNTTEKTQGIGYYGSSEMNQPVMAELSLDRSFARKESEYGTDIFVLGFKTLKDWKTDIVCKVLDSFMSAIVFGTLEVIVDDVILTKANLQNIVFDPQLVKKNNKSIVSQYLLLTDTEHRYEDTLEIEGVGDAKLYLLEFDEEHEHLATNGCVMIRYPFMKIKDLTKITTLPCSAMCIIGDNKLTRILRDVENPQHTDWEFKRIEDESEQNEIRAIYKDLTDQIKTTIANHLASSDESKTDIEGAGNFLPSVETGETKQEEKKKVKITDKPSIQKKKVKSQVTNINASIPDPDGNGVEVDIGVDSEEGEDIFTPEGHNNSRGASSHLGEHQSTGTENEDGRIIYKRSELRGMNYTFYCIDKSKRQYGITFISDFTEEMVSVSLKALDDSGSGDDVDIQECLINGTYIEKDKNGLIMFSIKRGEQVVIEMVTDQEELFSGEVKVYAYR